MSRYFDGPDAYWSDACLPRGNGQCDGYVPEDEQHAHQECACGCHKDYTDLPDTVEGVRLWHNTLHGVWRMYAGRGEDSIGPYFAHVSTHPMYPKAHGHDEIVEVDVVEDSNGRYLGWIDAPGLFTSPKYDGVPVMIQQHEILFRVQFPYGIDAETERGRGRVVHLEITEAK